jgi:hypothetical protein
MEERQSEEESQGARLALSTTSPLVSVQHYPAFISTETYDIRDDDVNRAFNGAVPSVLPDPDNALHRIP